MALTFLCPVHRDWVYFHPQESLSYLEDTQHQGESFLQEQDWHEATAYLGCAFETTEILMELQGGGESFLLSRLTCLAGLLASAFTNLKANSYAQLILQQARKKLEDAANTSLGNKPRLAFIQQCLFVIRTNQEQFKAKHPLEHVTLSERVH